MAATPEVDRADAMLGRVLDGRWKIIDLIGAGGMGAVYRAEHTTIGKSMAVKVLHPRLGTKGDWAKRFEREAQVGGKIGHPNCVAVSDFGTLEDGSFYLVMELLQGESLGDILDREAPLPWRRALHITRHVLRGLGHAHEHGVVHRDIKPDNVFLARHDDDPDFAKILDFGIAKLVGEGGTTITQAGITVGTPAYLSPEQAFGGELDGRSDLYSLSVVLYEMLVGRTPFGDRDMVAMLTAHAVADPPAMAEVAPDAAVPPPVEALVRQGLAKQPGDRFQTATEYVARIDDLLGRVPTTSGVHSAPYPSGVHSSAQTPLPYTPAPMAAIAPPLVSGTHPMMLPPRPWKRTAGYVAGAVLVVGLVAALASRGGEPAKAPGPAPAKTSPKATKPAPKPPAPKPPEPTPPKPADPEPAATAPADGPIAQIREEQYKAAIQQLAKGKTCEQRKAAVAKLRELGDKRAIPALKKARYRMRGGILGLGDSNTNKCLKADAEAAIAALSG
jgi:eukaryotic-like serine/threonine-protein kinase